MSLFPEKDCTIRCRSSAHAQQIQSCIYVATSSQLRSYAVWLCHNFATVLDKQGRNLVHVVASHGDYQTLLWLLKQCKAEIDTKDGESKWTPLHRACYYGQLVSARVLYMNGANLKSMDRDGLTSLDIVMKDRLPYIEYLPTDPTEVYVWGSNFNYNLGLGNSQCRETPEVLEVFRKDSVDIRAVQISKFYTVFLSLDGRVYTCGYGQGGRLGQDTEDIVLVPSLVKGLGSEKCVEAAAGQDHLLLLMENEQVLSCGLNTYNQLGHIPPMERLLVPKPLPLKFLKGKRIVGIRAAKFHSVIYTEHAIFTFGLNAGQLGHQKGDRTENHPRQVSGLHSEDCSITHVEASDGATICATSRGDVYVMQEYQIRKITSRQLEIKKLCVVGGQLDPRCDAAGVKAGGGLELKVAMLTKSGRLFLWRQTDPYLRRCLLTSSKELILLDAHLNHNTMALVSSQNEAFLGDLLPFKGKRTAPPPSTSVNLSLKTSTGLVTLLEREHCHSVKVKRLPVVFRATSITSDVKGRNFAVLQSSPKMGLVEVPVISPTKMQDDFSRLLSEATSYDDFHDIVIKVDKREFPCHMFILASRSEYFRKHFTKCNLRNREFVLDNVKPETFEQVLQFIYSNHCDYLRSGHPVKWAQNKEVNGKKSSGTKALDPISDLQQLSKRLGLNRLHRKLKSVKIVNGKISVADSDLVPKLSFSRKSLPNLCDVNLLSKDDVVFNCHKCILVARLEYFHHMLGTSWSENSKLDQLSMPMSSQVLKVILDFLYSDGAEKVVDSEDAELLCQVLVISDQLFINRLKEITEIALVRIMTLKNAAEILHLSAFYNSEQLKKSCMQFICINLPAILESRCLDILSDDVMEELTSYYRSLVPGMRDRKIRLFCSPSTKELEEIETQFPINVDEAFERQKPDTTENKVNRRLRTNSTRSEIKGNTTPTKNDNLSNTKNNTVLQVDDPPVKEIKVKQVIPIPKMKKDFVDTKLFEKSMFPEIGTNVMQTPLKEATLNLDSNSNLISLQRNSSKSNFKPMPHVSQKQKKLLDVQNKTDYLIPSSPPNKTSCPWAKLPQESPPSPSFWDSVGRKSSQSSLGKSDICMSPEAFTTSEILSKSPSSNEIVISLHDIQKDEEKKLRRSLTMMTKSLHILNIEDEAIEELCELYKVQDNWGQKITVSRVQVEEVASPVWRRK